MEGDGGLVGRGEGEDDVLLDSRGEDGLGGASAGVQDTHKFPREL